ncbi:MAG: hypothetical protein HKN09_10655 [Saprospiraceae bacterium]|nr:hypothetical protein [Saprospiraceae bacterium]
MSPKSNNSKSLLGIALILVLLALNAYQWMSNSKLKSELNEKKTAFLELEKLNTELNQDYEDALTDLEDMRTDNADLNALIDAQKAELKEQKNRISGLIWTERELGKARKELNSFKDLADQYVAEITTLKEENAVLTDANKALIAKNTTLTQDLETSRDQISELDSQKTILLSTANALSETNEQLSGKVDMAEAIKINYIEVSGFDVKDNGKLAEKGRAKKVEMLRTCFTTETNLVTAAGPKDFYVTYTAPSGEVLYVEELGSGRIKDKLNNKEVMYTASGTVDYKNDEMTACLDWRPNFSLGKGLYKVAIYNNGFNVGNGEFKLK